MILCCTPETNKMFYVYSNFKTLHANWLLCVRVFKLVFIIFKLYVVFTSFFFLLHTRTTKTLYVTLFHVVKGTFSKLIT